MQVLRDRVQYVVLALVCVHSPTISIYVSKL